MKSQQSSLTDTAVPSVNVDSSIDYDHISPLRTKSKLDIKNSFLFRFGMLFFVIFLALCGLVIYFMFRSL